MQRTKSLEELAEDKAKAKAEAKAKKEAEAKKENSASVFHEDGGLIRTYSLEVHGEKYKELAKKAPIHEVILNMVTEHQ